MLTSLVLIAIPLLTILLITFLHLPAWLQHIVLWIPAWLQSAVIHFAYGGWIGGVTGHVVGGLLSVPWFFISKYWLKPRLNRARNTYGRLAPHALYGR